MTSDRGVEAFGGVVVLGAGPAGSLVARGMALRGVPTILAERTAFPRAKLCGGCLARPGQRALLDAGLELASVSGAPRIDRLDLRTGDRALRLRVPAYRVVDRAAFDAELADAAADAGVCVRPRTTGRVLADGTVVLETDGREERLGSAVVVVADGLKGSALRGHPAFGWRLGRASHVGVGAIARSMPAGLASDAITMFHGPHGYLGVAPLSACAGDGDSGRADIAAAVDPAWIASHSDGVPLRALLASFGLDGAGIELEAGPLGAPHLTRRRAAVEDAGRVFVCGDSAGYLEPFTGEGMTWALEAATRLVPRLVEVLEGRYVPGAWTRDVRRARHRVLCRGVSAVLRRPGLTGAIAAVGDAVPPVALGLSAVVGALQWRPARRGRSGPFGSGPIASGRAISASSIGGV